MTTDLRWMDAEVARIRGTEQGLGEQELARKREQEELEARWPIFWSEFVNAMTMLFKAWNSRWPDDQSPHRVVLTVEEHRLIVETRRLKGGTIIAGREHCGLHVTRVLHGVAMTGHLKARLVCGELVVKDFQERLMNAATLAEELFRITFTLALFERQFGAAYDQVVIESRQPRPATPEPERQRPPKAGSSKQGSMSWSQGPQRDVDGAR